MGRLSTTECTYLPTSESQEKGASGFCMDANQGFASLLRQGLRFKAK